MAETGFARKKFSLFQAETKFDLVSAFPLMYDLDHHDVSMKEQFSVMSVMQLLTLEIY